MTREQRAMEKSVDSANPAWGSIAEARDLHAESYALEVARIKGAESNG